MRSHTYRHGDITHTESECNWYLSKVTSKLKDEQLCCQARAIIAESLTGLHNLKSVVEVMTR